MCFKGMNNGCFETILEIVRNKINLGYLKLKFSQFVDRLKFTRKYTH